MVVQSYRHRFGYAEGDPALEGIEGRLAAQPVIAASTVALHGAADGVAPVSQSAGHAGYFAGSYRREIIDSAGHNLPQEAPEPVVEAILALMQEF